MRMAIAPVDLDEYKAQVRRELDQRRRTKLVNHGVRSKKGAA
jgi:hypothetical protein